MGANSKRNVICLGFENYQGDLMQHSLLLDAMVAIKSFFHACVIPLLLTILFHNIFVGLAYVGVVFAIYHFLVQERKEYFLFSLGLSSIIIFSTFFVGALGSMS